MRDPIRINLEYLASTYGIDPLGFAFIEYVEDGRRILVLEDMDTRVDPQGMTNTR